MPARGLRTTTWKSEIGHLSKTRKFRPATQSNKSRMSLSVHPEVVGGFPAEGKNDTKGGSYILVAAQGWVAQTQESALAAMNFCTGVHNPPLVSSLSARRSEANCKRVALWSPRRTATTSCKKARRVLKIRLAASAVFHQLADGEQVARRHPPGHLVGHGLMEGEVISWVIARACWCHNHCL
jgi:hypothetical protein